jgi:hypothetical protein
VLVVLQIPLRRVGRAPTPYMERTVAAFPEEWVLYDREDPARRYFW